MADPQYPAGKGGMGWIRLDWPASVEGQPAYTYAHPQFRWSRIIESDGFRWGLLEGMPDLEGEHVTAASG